MVISLPPNNKTLALHNQKQFVSTVFYSNRKILTISLILFLNRAYFYTQNGWSWLHKSTLNNMNISLRKISQIKPGSLVCFPELFQEFPLWSTYPLLQSKMKKENCIIWLFVFSFSVMVRSLSPLPPPTTKLSLHISKNCLSLQFYTLSEKTFTFKLNSVSRKGKVLYTEWLLVNAQINFEQQEYFNSYNFKYQTGLPCLLR